MYDDTQVIIKINDNLYGSFTVNDTSVNWIDAITEG